MKTVLIFSLILVTLASIVAGEILPKPVSRHLPPDKRELLLSEVRRHYPERAVRAEQDDDFLESIILYPGDLDEKANREKYIAAHIDELVETGKLDHPDRSVFEKVATPALDALFACKLTRSQSAELYGFFTIYWCEPPESRERLLDRECSNPNRFVSKYGRSHIDIFLSKKFDIWFTNKKPLNRWHESTPRLKELLGRELTTSEVVKLVNALRAVNYTPTDPKTGHKVDVPADVLRMSRIGLLKNSFEKGITPEQCEQLLSGDAGDWIVEKSDEEPPGPTIIRR